MIYNVITATFGELSKTTTKSINYQYDTKQILKIEDLDLPAYYEVDFCNEGDTQTITMIGTDAGVQIPDNYLQTGKRVKAYVVVQDDDDGAVETRYEITIPVKQRPTRADIQPTPAEQLQIDTLIDSLNAGVSAVEAVIEAVNGIRFELDENQRLYIKIGGDEI